MSISQTKIVKMNKFFHAIVLEKKLAWVKGSLRCYMCQSCYKTRKYKFNERIELVLFSVV